MEDLTSFILSFREKVEKITLLILAGVVGLKNKLGKVSFKGTPKSEYFYKDAPDGFCDYDSLAKDHIRHHKKQLDKDMSSLTGITSQWALARTNIDYSFMQRAKRIVAVHLESQQTIFKIRGESYDAYKIAEILHNAGFKVNLTTDTVDYRIEIL